MVNDGWGWMVIDGWQRIITECTSNYSRKNVVNDLQ